LLVLLAWLVLLGWLVLLAWLVLLGWLVLLLGWLVGEEWPRLASGPLTRTFLAAIADAAWPVRAARAVGASRLIWGARRGLLTVVGGQCRSSGRRDFAGCYVLFHH
jgi:hypothetical protein